MASGEKKERIKIAQSRRGLVERREEKEITQSAQRKETQSTQRRGSRNKERRSI